MSSFQVVEIRKEFPIFQKKHPNGKELVYLDNAASTQKPQKVLDAITDFYTSYYSNIGRGIYWPASISTREYELARKQVADFINAPSSKTIVFTSGATDAINKVTSSYLIPRLKEDDEVVISEMEHHSNLIPWQMACLQTGATLKVIPIHDSGELDMEAFKTIICGKTRFLAITALSNTLGVINDVKTIVEKAHEQDIPVLVDAAQSIAHEPIDVSQLDCDFLVFSGHKIYGPTGIGILYGKEDLLDDMVPLQYGGGTVAEVLLENSSFLDSPVKHEAGTPNIAGAIGLASALKYVEEIGKRQIHLHTTELLQYARKVLEDIDQLTILGNPAKQGPILSFMLSNIHPHDVSGFLAEQGIAIRAGHHCTQPLIDHFGLPGTCRISFAMYNTKDEIDLLGETLKSTSNFFK